jgi:hypothetical protein
MPYMVVLLFIGVWWSLALLAAPWVGRRLRGLTDSYPAPRL